MKYYLLLLAICFLPIITRCQAPVTKIYIVRHADRLGQADDISPLGVVRANELKRVLGLSKIDSIFSTNFIRTKKTATPLAVLRGLPVKVYADIPTIINHIVNNCAGKKILIVGHSDTVDDLIRRCGCTPPASIDPNMPASQYDHLFLVLVQKIPGQPALKCENIHMKYGAVTN